MRNLKHLLFLFAFSAAVTFCSLSAKAQASADAYASIKARPSTIRWCLPEAGDDPAHIISGVCGVYRECLSGATLDKSVDRTPFRLANDADSIARYYGVCRYPSLDHLLLSAPTLDQRSSPYSPKPRGTPTTHCYSRNNAAIPQTLSIAIGFLPARTHGSTNSSHSATGRAHS